MGSLRSIWSKYSACSRSVAGRAADRFAGSGRHVALRLDPGGGDLRGLLHPGRQHAVADQEDVRAEAGALVPGGHLGDHPGDRHLPESGDVAAGDDDVVELQVGVLVERDVEAQRGGVLGAEDSADVRLPLLPRSARTFALLSGLQRHLKHPGDHPRSGQLAWTRPPWNFGNWAATRTALVAGC